MKELTVLDLKDILLGCTLLGTGGGGDPAEGWHLIERAVNSGKKFVLAGLDELPEDGIVAVPYFVGSLGGKKLDSVYKEGEVVRSYKLLEDYMGKQFYGVLSTELGGANTAVALMTAAMMGYPIVDGDPAGRSVPELQHTTYYIKGIGMCPFSVVTPFGDEMVVPTVSSDFMAERIVRAVVWGCGTNVGVTSHPVSGDRLKEAVIGGAITDALNLGRVIREHAGTIKGVVEALVGEGGWYLLFEGVCIDALYEEREGFTVGHFVLQGEGDFTGHRYKVYLKNENMYSEKDGRIDVTVPDLISVVDEEGMPVTNPNVLVGKRYAVVGLPAPSVWRTQGGLNIFGPKYLGLDVDYVPIEESRGGV